MYDLLCSQVLPVESVPEKFPLVSTASVVADDSSSYPLLDISQCNFNPSSEHPQSVEWGGKSMGHDQSLLSSVCGFFLDIFVVFLKYQVHCAVGRSRAVRIASHL